MSTFLAGWPLTATAVQEGVDLTFLDIPLHQEHLVLAGRAIAYAFAMTQVQAWVDQTEHDVSRRARLAMNFLKADIRAIAVEFALLSDGVVD